MIDIGHFALIAAWALSLYALVGGLIGAAGRRVRLQESAANGVIAVGALTLFSLAALAVLFLTHDYRYAYVWQNSNNEMAAPYLISAIWGGMDGSMLLWAAMVAGFSAVAVVRTTELDRGLRPW
ncbi:MAG: c-type cytochrome biogenesis protein CcmF, partial [Bdellovibrionales bacterium]|nr:c-type cytochrome biogenesis protein CcmF [Bdellovibrionales bacterium]